MISRPLFIIVAESIVIFGPIFQVGCASASATVIAPKVASGRSRNGPPDAVSTSRATSSWPPQRSAWWIAQCSESTGTISAPLAFAVAHHELARRRRASPCSRARGACRRPPRRRPIAARARRRGRRPPCRRSDARRLPRVPRGRRRSGARRRPEGARAGAPRRRPPRPRRAPADAATICSARRSTERPAASATTRNRSGSAAATSSAEQPIEPVEPRTARFFMRNGQLYGPAPRPGRRRGPTRAAARRIARAGPAKSSESIRS